MNRAEELGLRAEFDSGFVVMKYTPNGDTDRQTEILEELGNQIVHVRRFAQHAIAARGKELLGQRVWFPDHGEGTLRDAGGDGLLDVLIIKNAASGRPQSFSAYAEHLLVLVEDT